VLYNIKYIQHKICLCLSVYVDINDLINDVLYLEGCFPITWHYNFHHGKQRECSSVSLNVGLNRARRTRSSVWKEFMRLFTTKVPVERSAFFRDYRATSFKSIPLSFPRTVTGSNV